MNEKDLEKAINSKGLNALRLHPEHIDGVIASHYFHFDEAAALTICVMQLVNGFTVIGTSAAMSPGNFDKDIGKGIAYKNAREQIWLLEGYLLRQRIFEQ